MRFFVPAQLVHERDDLLFAFRIEAAGYLITEKEHRISNQLEGERKAGDAGPRREL